MKIRLIILNLQALLNISLKKRSLQQFMHKTSINSNNYLFRSFSPEITSKSQVHPHNLLIIATNNKQKHKYHSVHDIQAKSYIKKRSSEGQNVFRVQKSTKSNDSALTTFKFTDNGKKYIRKSFNKTQTDLDHNFVGKKYLLQIQNQKKSIRQRIRSTKFVRDCKMDLNQLNPHQKLVTAKPLNIFKQKQQRQTYYKVLKHRDRFRVFQKKNKQFTIHKNIEERLLTQTNSPQLSLRRRTKTLCFPINSLQMTKQQKEMNIVENTEIAPWDDQAEMKWMHKI